MTVLILGPSGSGKSVFAEQLTSSISDGPLIYAATMIPYGEEGRRRVERHREQRREYGFTTLETQNLSESDIPAGAAVLLEDVSNLLGSAVFIDKRSAQNVLDDIIKLSERCAHLVLVSISGIAEADGGDEETQAYIRDLNFVNRELSQLADKVYMMEDGIPYERDYT